MTDPRKSRLGDSLGAVEDQLLQLYRHHASETPPPALDRRILDLAAQAAAAENSPVRGRRPPAWLSIAASTVVVVLGAGLGWRMLEQQPQGEIARRAEQRVAATEASAPAEPAGAAVPEALRERAAAPRTASTPADQVSAESAAAPAPDSADAAAGMPGEPEAPAADRVRAAPPPAPPAAAPPVRPPPPAAAAGPAPASAPPLPMQPQAPAAVATPAPAPASTTAPAAEPAATGLAKRATAVSPLDPQRWLEDIRKLAAAGHVDEARVSLREWRDRYPNLEIPSDLQVLLPELQPR